MGVLVIYKELPAGRPAPGHDTYLTEWVQNIGLNMGYTGLILKNVSTVFNANNHGYYNGCLRLSWFDSTGLVKSEWARGDAVPSILQTVDLRWDGASRVCAFDPHLRLGRVCSPGPYVQITLSASVAPGASELGGGNPVIWSGDSTSSYVIPTSNALLYGGAAPLSIALTFEYDDASIKA